MKSLFCVALYCIASLSGALAQCNTNTGANKYAIDVFNGVSSSSTKIGLNPGGFYPLIGHVQGMLVQGNKYAFSYSADSGSQKGDLIVYDASSGTSNRIDTPWAHPSALDISEGLMVLPMERNANGEASSRVLFYDMRNWMSPVKLSFEINRENCCNAPSAALAMWNGRWVLAVYSSNIPNVGTGFSIYRSIGLDPANMNTPGFGFELLFHVASCEGWDNMKGVVLDGQYYIIGFSRDGSRNNYMKMYRLDLSPQRLNFVGSTRYMYTVDNNQETSVGFRWGATAVLEGGALTVYCSGRNIIGGSININRFVSPNTQVRLFYDTAANYLTELPYYRVAWANWNQRTLSPVISKSSIASISWNNGAEIRIYSQRSNGALQETAWTYNQWLNTMNFQTAPANTGITVVSWDNGAQVRLFSQDSNFNLVENAFTSAGWAAPYTVPGILMGRVTPMSAVSWKDSVGYHYRIYWLDINGAVRETTYDDDLGWRFGNQITVAQASSNSGIAAIMWFDNGSVRIRVYIVNMRGELEELGFDVNGWYVQSLGLSIAINSQLSAISGGSITRIVYYQATNNSYRQYQYVAGFGWLQGGTSIENIPQGTPLSVQWLTGL
eukprot:TRINITY_DN779_c0_g1_i1.p1 TRINITY_DN779_c0_g1~~TRINITY_DN779_c0_g1_i1.p1  ORF type:complete len:609 (-),score=111.47 TRINITY_DN779_c0_g1_i1:46-1872(-)